MMKHKIIYILLGVAVCLGSCENNPGDTTGYDPRPVDISAETATLIGTSNVFCFDFFSEVLQDESEEKNIMVSPLSVSLALAMVYNGAEGETKTAMENAMRLEGLSRQEINESFLELVTALLKLDSRILLNIANSVWYRNTVTVRDPFVKTLEQYYKARVSPLDFKDPSSVSTINKWVADNTRNKITKIIEVIKAEDIMYLINAIYFKGTWTYGFNSQNTSLKNFYFPDGTSSEAPTMYMKTDVDFFSTSAATGIILPYGQGNFNMAVVLPAEGMDPLDVAGSLSDVKWEQWLSTLSAINGLEIYLPKFRFEFRAELEQVLTRMGMGIAFSEAGADFSGINEILQLFISSVLHKTFIEVNEEGTEAAAVTSVTVGVTSMPPVQVFRVDRPFLFIIYEKMTKAILFIGRVADPLSSN